MTDSSRTDLEAAIGGRFHVYRELGRGGFGAVYEAEPAGEPGTKVALKVLERPPGMGSQFEERFLREVRNAQRVRHPYAVRIFEYGAIPDGRLFYTMELCQGPSLRDLDTPPASVAVSRLVRVVTQALEALDAAHPGGGCGGHPHATVRARGVFPGGSFDRRCGIPGGHRGDPDAAAPRAGAEGRWSSHRRGERGVAARRPLRVAAARVRNPACAYL